MLKRITLIAVAALIAGAFSHPTAAQDLTTAEDVIKANIEATGGEAAWKAVEDMHMVIEVNVDTPMGAISVKADSWSIFPGYGFTEMSLLDGPDGIPAEAVAMKAYYTPLEGWIEQGGQRQDMSALPAQARQQFMRSSAKAELALLTDDAELTLKSDSTINGRDVYVVGTTQSGMSIDYFFDKETLMVAAMSAAGSTTYLSDYQEIDGLMFAMSQSVESAQQNQSISVKSIEFDTGLTPAQLATKSGTRKQAVPE